jgi:carboxylate-amine ligase
MLRPWIRRAASCTRPDGTRPRHGLSGTLLDPRQGTQGTAADVVHALLDRVSNVLAESGDAARVAAGAQRLLDEGTGTARQRRAAAEGGLDAVLGLITQGVRTSLTQGAAHPRT